MANHNTEQEFAAAIKDCRGIFEKKLKDYGAAWRILRPSSLTDQILIKASRIRSLETKGEAMVNEGIQPEFVGIVNYGVVGLIQLELRRPTKSTYPPKRRSRSTTNGLARPHG